MTVDVRYGDAWVLADQLEPDSIDCIVTSPPYWSLRDYGHPGQFGLERTPHEYVAKLRVFSAAGAEHRADSSGPQTGGKHRESHEDARP